MIGCEITDNVFYRESCYGSKKPRFCEETGKIILEGERYVYIAYKNEDHFGTVIQSLKGYHICRALHRLYEMRYGRGECVIPFGGLREVDPEDIASFAKFGTSGHYLVIRILKFVGRINCSRYSDVERGLSDSPISELSEADWRMISRLSYQYATGVEYDAFGEKIS